MEALRAFLLLTSYSWILASFRSPHYQYKMPTRFGIIRSVERHKLVLWLLAATFTLPAGAADVDARNAEAPGVPNFHIVNEHLYRGGQPAGAGWRSLAKLGVKTVIDLRLESEHSISKEALAVEAAGMIYISQPMSRLAAPTNEEISKILTLLNSSEKWPVFIHCRRGADRTGTVIACYRIVHNQWASDEALQEARTYGMSRLEVGMKHFIQNFHLDGAAGEAGSQISADQR
jgi:tyrosine-protein phosphatase SIW14